MDEEAGHVFIPSDMVAERMMAYCGLMAQIEGTKSKDVRAEALKFAEAVRMTITPKSEPASLSVLKGGAAKPL